MIARARSASRLRVAALPRLLRPRIQAAVLVSLLPTLALEGLPPAAALGALALGTLLTGACCDAFNAGWEGSRDALMARTRERPVATGEIGRSTAFAIAAACGLLGVALLHAAAGALGAGLAAGAILLYCGAYTAWLKPRTPLAAILGGAAGCVGPLLADACDGRLSAAGLVPVLVLFTWTPPHVWAIACWRRDDYERGGYPCLPVVAGCPRARLWGLAWLALLVPVSLVSFAGARSASWCIIVLGLDAVLIAAFVRAWARPGPAEDRRAFLASVRWLAAWLLVLLAFGLPGAAS